MTGPTERIITFFCSISGQTLRIVPPPLQLQRPALNQIYFVIALPEKIHGKLNIDRTIVRLFKNREHIPHIGRKRGFCEQIVECQRPTEHVRLMPLSAALRSRAVSREANISSGRFWQS